MRVYVCICIDYLLQQHILCIVAADSLHPAPMLWRVTCSVGGFTARTESAPQALVSLVGARSEITERAHFTFFSAPSGSTSVGANFS